MATYYIRNHDPRMTADHNKCTWRNVKALAATHPSGLMEEQALRRVVAHHRSPSDPRVTGDGFIRYCIKMKWLAKV